MHKLLVVLISVFFLAGCHTMNGVGKDLEQAGEAIQKKSSQ
jgi:entericidin B